MEPPMDDFDRMKDERDDALDLIYSKIDESVIDQIVHIVYCENLILSVEELISSEAYDRGVDYYVDKEVAINLIIDGLKRELKEMKSE